MAFSPLLHIVLACCCYVLLFAAAGCSTHAGRDAQRTTRSLRGEVLAQRDRLLLEPDSPLPRPPAPAELSEEPVPEEPHDATALPAAPASEGAASTAENPVLAAQPGEDRPPPAVAGDESLADLLASARTPQQAGALRCVEQGRLLLQSGQQERAREWFERALSLDPHNPYAYYFLARHALLRQRPDQAHAFAERALQVASGLDRRWRGRLEALQGEIFESVGRFSEARRAYQQAAEWDPLNATARAGLARLASP